VPPVFAKCERRRHCRAPISGSSHCGVWVVFKASRGSWAVSWDDDRTQEFTWGASSTKTRT